MFRGVLLVAALTGCGRIGFSPLTDDTSDATTGDAAGDAQTVQPPGGATIVFHFDENAGTSTTSTGTVLTGTLNDAGWTPGIRGSAVDLGPAGFVDLPVSSALQLTGELTISIWYQLERALAADECVNLLIHGSAGSSGPSDNDIYAFNLIEPRFVLYSERQAQLPNGTGSAPVPEALTPNVWHHAIAKRSPSGVAFHFDGNPALAALSQPAGVDGGTAGHLRIGADVEVSTCGSFPGALDELYIYPRFLDDTESRMLFEAR